MTTKNSPDSAELVSIICRTTNRPELAAALESIAAQDYPEIEVVLVDALGRKELPAAALADPSVRVVSTGKPLKRSAAANAGLEQARGKYLMFLDEDDWIDPDHVTSLHRLLQENPSVRAAYSDTIKTTPNGESTIQVFDADYDPATLMRDNLCPIHAVLFEASLIGDGCRFDTAFDIYEDWDFWLQVARHTEFLHHPHASAYYRGGGDSDTAVSEVGHKYESGHPNALAREKVIAKWLPQWSAEDINRMLGSADRTGDLLRLENEISSRDAMIGSLNSSLQETEKSLHQKRLMLARLNESLHGLNQRLDANVKEMQELQAAHQRLNRMHEELDRDLKRILRSFSWRVTRPLRFLKRLLATYLWQPIKPFFVKQILNNPELHERLVEIRSDSRVTAGDGVVFCNIDYPSNSFKLFADELVIRGWAFSDKGRVRVRVSIDDRDYGEFTPSIYRQDVLNLYKGMANAEHSGFVEKLPLPELNSGRHSIVLTARNELGAENQADAEFHFYRTGEVYNAWRQYRIDDLANSLVKDKGELQGHKPGTIAVILQTAGDAELLRRSYASLRTQYHREFEIIIVGLDPDADPDAHPQWLGREWVSAVLGRDACREALDLALQNASYVLPLRAGSLLTPFALLQFLLIACREDAALVYSDHDTEFGENLFGDTEFTFGWSPDHLISRNYIGSTFLMRCDALRGFVDRLPGNGAWAYRALCEMTETDYGVQRIPRVLWSHPGITTRDREAELREETATLEDFLGEHHPGSSLEVSEHARSVNWQLPDDEQLPLVSIIIPTTGKLQLLKPCLESLLGRTTYPNFELVVLDNSRGKNPEGIEYLGQQDLTLIECDEDFNWARLNNKGAAAARGEFLLFLNDDIEIIQDDWLQELLRQARRPAIGVVGCRLLYNNGHLQHAGVLLVNYGGGCLHIFHKMPMGHSIYRRLDQCVREVSANTGACILIGRDRFECMNGFDEELSVVGNDVDLCLRLIDEGYRNIWTPRTTLIHHESISREANTPQENELAMWSRWGNKFNSGDTYYNPNLSNKKVDCSQEFDVAEDVLLDKLAALSEKRSNAGGRAPLPGVNLIGYIRADMGLGEAIRADARALHVSGMEFGIINFESGNPSRMSNMSWRHKEILTAPYDINLIHVNADFLSLVREELPDHFFSGRYNIAYWAWELEELPDEWLLTLDYIDEVWVPSEFVNAAVAAKTNLPVVTIPHNVDLRPCFFHSRAYFGIPESSFVFLAMYDTRSVAARKNPEAALKAFVQAFAEDDDSVTLVLKVNNSNADNMDTLKEAIAGRDNIVLLEQSYGRDEINSLLTIADCFLSLHRSEGFGLGPAEVMSLGKPCILTNWSGNTDYMTGENCLAVDFELVTLEEDYGPYRAGQRWAEADIDQASDYMKRLVADPELKNRLGAAARQTINEHFSPHAVGEKIIARIEEIRASRERSATQTRALARG